MEGDARADRHRGRGSSVALQTQSHRRLTMDLWTYSTVDTKNQLDLTGYDVVARDGSIGKIDEASYEAGQSALVVDTGFWIFGKKRVIPAGMIERIDTDDRNVYVRMTKEQIKNAPDWEADTWRTDAYRTSLGNYYRDY
jgi:hypothetical protein